MFRGRSAAAAVVTPVSRVEPHLAAVEVERHAVRAQEAVADDAAELEPEQHAGRAQVEHHHREVAVLDVAELQVEPLHQERVAVPARGAVDLQRDAAAERPAGRSASAVALLIEITSPPVSTTK